MSAELYFIYDSHCPWSYAATPLLTAVAKARKDITIHTLHSAYYDGNEEINAKTIKDIKALSPVLFDSSYSEKLPNRPNSTLVANLMGWVEQKAHGKSLTLLEAIQKSHFEEGTPAAEIADIEAIIDYLKLSPPQKSLKSNKLIKEAEFALGDIEEIQNIIGTKAIPALLLAMDDELVLLNHNLYIGKPETIVDAIALELGE